MSTNLKKWLLGLGLWFFLGTNASAQVAAFDPLTEPSDFQYFVQPDLSPYGSGVIPTTGWFGSIEYILWSTSAPNKTEIGLDGAMRTVYNGNYGYMTQTNSADTNFIRAAMTSGTRFELGFMNDEDKGWFFSGYTLNPNVDRLTQTSASMVFAEGTFTATDGSINGGGIRTFPTLFGFVDNFGIVNGTGNPVAPAAGVGTNLPDGVADDINRNNIYGVYGLDRVTAAVAAAGTTPLDRNPSSPFATVPNPTGAQAYDPIDYGDLVPLPVLFSDLQVMHKSRNYSVELNRQWRLCTTRFGGTFDVFAGPRYTNFYDQLMVNAIGGVLADSYWNAQAQNNAVGAQAGFRLDQKYGRLSLSTEGRVFNGANLQTVRLNGQIGSELTTTVQNPTYTTATNTLVNGGGTNEGGGTTPPSVPAASTYTQSYQNGQANNPGRGTTAVRLNQPLGMNATAFSGSKNFVSYSPLGELRFKAQYQVWDAVKVNAGWTGTWIGGVMRSNNMIDYTLPSMAISTTQRTQGVFINGFNMGVEINR